MSIGDMLLVLPDPGGFGTRSLETGQALKLARNLAETFKENL
jgi:hypothetical protein